MLPPRLLKIQVRSKAEIKQPFPPLLISKNHKKANFICIWYLDNICEYLFIKTETAMLSPHFVLLMRTPIVMPRPASSFLNISTISVRCSMAVPTGRDVGRLRRSGYTGPMVAHPQSPARVLRTHQSGILPRPHYGVHKVRLTFARPSPILCSPFA